MKFKSNFQAKVLKLTSLIPKGKVTSYKEIAKKLNTSPRAVAGALAANHYPIKIPCHRVVCCDGKLGGYTPKGSREKARLLREEGVKVSKNVVDKPCFMNLK